MRQMRTMKGLALSVILLSGIGVQAEGYTSETSDMLKNYLEKNPQADADGNGVLTEDEHLRHLPQALLEVYGVNGVHRHVMIPLRDGVEVAAEVFLPGEEGGPWPVLLSRAEYGRWRTHDCPKDAGGQGFVYVAHETRKYEQGKHANWQDQESSINEQEDGYDVVEWIASQPWSNGRIGTVGGSGHGYASAMMFWANIPHYTVNGVHNTAGNVKLYWCRHNGVRRGTSYNWIGVRGASPNAEMAPTLTQEPYDHGAWLDFIRARSGDIHTWYFNNTGWFDPMSEGALDDFAALQHTGKAHVRVEPRCHGGMNGLPGGLKIFPERGAKPAILEPPTTMEILKGAEAPEGLQSTLTYFLMGDVLDAEAPGNRWMTTHTWPVPHDMVPFYLHANGSLSTNEPTEAGGAVSYTYDPKQPAPTIGGHHDWGEHSGPWDQRPLRQRDDVRYFVTEPLSEPFAITGKLRMKLFFSSDARDTAFVVKVVDIYPDGYEAIIRESAGMGRFHSGYSSPSPLEEGQVVDLDLDLWSTAMVFNKGHRIGVIVTSSSEKSYEVHPNTFEPTKADYANAPVARNTIHCTPESRSVLLLPRVAVPPKE
jgi:predicted acyl esterase